MAEEMTRGSVRDEFTLFYGYSIARLEEELGLTSVLHVLVAGVSDGFSTLGFRA